MNIEAHPLYIYAALAVGVLLLTANAAPKILGPLGRAASEWSQRRREERIAQGAAEMSEVQKQVAFLTEQREKDKKEHEEERRELRRDQAEYRRMWAEREDRWRREWNEHIAWDYDMIHLAHSLGADPPPMPAPPFMTPDPPRSQEMEE